MSSNIQEWNGDSNHLPEKEFSFKGQVYTWKPCDCSEHCQRPLAYKDGHVDLELTTRLRGADQGDYMSSVLVKLGKMEELIIAGANRALIADLLEITLFAMLPLPGTPKFDEMIEKYGISELELIFATGEAAGIPEEITRMRLFGGLNRGFSNARKN